MRLMRNLLSQDPMSFNELLDLFEAYVSTIGAIAKKSHDMLREEIGDGQHVALGQIFGVSCDSEDMVKRLIQIRTARNSGIDVSITMTREVAVATEKAADDAQNLLAEAAAVLGLLYSGIGSGHLSRDEYAILSVISLTQRALVAAEEKEGSTLSHMARKLREAGKYQHIDQEVAA